MTEERGTDLCVNGNHIFVILVREEERKQKMGGDEDKRGRRKVKVGRKTSQTLEHLVFIH